MKGNKTRQFEPAAVVIAGLLASACVSVAAQPQSTEPVVKRVDSALSWGACPPIFPAGCEIAVLHGDPAEPNVDVFLRVPGGYKIPAHRHTSAERMILIEGELSATYKGAPAATLAAGAYAYGPPGVPHRAECLSEEPCVLFIAFEEPVDAEAFTGSID